MHSIPKFSVWFGPQDPRNAENLTLGDAFDLVAARLRDGEICLVLDGVDEVRLTKDAEAQLRVVVR